MGFSMKRATALCLAAILLLLLAACNPNPDPDTSTGTEATTTVPTETQTQGTVSAGVDFDVFDDEANKDPENTDDSRADGDKVDFSQVQVKEGLQNGIDVSKWQGRIDWQKVKEAGIDFAIIRIGYRGEDGQLYRDSNADYNIQQAQKAGILVGVYFFSTAVSPEEAEQEASWTVSAIQGYAISYPVVYDCEGFRNSESRMHALTAAQRTQNALRFLEIMENSGYEGAFYGSVSDLADPTAFHTAEIEKEYKIWVAQYKTPAYPYSREPDYSGRCDLWQYTNQGTVSGVPGNCDMVVSYFEKEQQAPKDENAEISPADPPKTEDELLYEDVEETVTAKEEVNLRTGPGKHFSVVTLLKNGTQVQRTGVGKNGWSRLEYNGQTVYAITSYLTTDLDSTPEPPPDVVEDQTFSAVNDTVTAKDEVNLRSTPSTTGEVVGVLKNGTQLQRLAVSNQGWSRLVYEGQTVYAVTSYLTEDLTYKPPEDDGLKTQFRDVNDQVTAKSETNLRTLPSVTDSEVVHLLKNGEYLTRTGISDNGWSRLTYNGQTVYAVSSYLTGENTDAPADDDGIKTQFREVNEQVTAKSETNLRTLPSVTDSEVVHLLKNGEYLTRTGISDNGWSRLQYNDQTVYAVSSYLTE